MMKSEKDFCGYWLKNIKTFKSQEGEIFQASVYKDNKKIGFFSEDGHGGPATLEGIKQYESPEIITLKEFAKAVDRNPSDESYHVFIAKIADTILFNRKIKRLCKTRIVFTYKSDPKDNYRTINRVFTGTGTAFKKAMKKQHNKIVDIVYNEEV